MSATEPADDWTSADPSRVTASRTVRTERHIHDIAIDWHRAAGAAIHILEKASATGMIDPDSREQRWPGVPAARRVP
jgi:hypothetical protein